jgi:hypothetical protein
MQVQTGRWPGARRGTAFVYPVVSVGKGRDDISHRPFPAAHSGLSAPPTPFVSFLSFDVEIR